MNNVLSNLMHFYVMILEGLLFYKIICKYFSLWNNV